MTTENHFSENDENKNLSDTPQEQKNNPSSENAETPETNTDPSVVTGENTVANPGYVTQEEDEEEERIDPATDTRSIEELTAELEKIANASDAGAQAKEFNSLRKLISDKIEDERDEKKKDFEESENADAVFEWEHSLQKKIDHIIGDFRVKHQQYLKKQEQEQEKHLLERQNIIEELKNLYTNAAPGTNLFKAIREIKDKWKNAGQVAKSEFSRLNNDYFLHLNHFYQILDLNKEYLEQEYAHNLETRKHIIARAKELENEPIVQKALNELQYLHKLWKDEAEPVAPEFRDSTWEEFKEISNKIHFRKSELSAQIEEEQNKNLEFKNQIIAKIKALTETTKQTSHGYWQNAIKEVENLRTEFLKTGSVPRKLSNQNWMEFKTTLRSFNAKKNEFYKSLKSNQQGNLEEKLKLIQTAKDNMNSEDWDVAVPLFKRLQEEWKHIGHVPRSMTNKVWDEFRGACNTFFDNFRAKNPASSDNWKENYNKKKAILDQLKKITNEEGSVEKIETLKTEWNTIGKVPRDKMSINTEFNKTLKEKLKLNQISEFDLNEGGLSEGQITDKARRIKNQIADLEAEVAKLENNIAFFSNASQDNPLLKSTFENIEQKKAQIESLKENLHHIIAGE